MTENEKEKLIWKIKEQGTQILLLNIEITELEKENKQLKNDLDEYIQLHDFETERNK